MTDCIVGEFNQFIKVRTLHDFVVNRFKFYNINLLHV